MNDAYYATTAFNSARPRALPPPPRKLTRVQRSALKYGVLGRGVQCREFLAADDVDVIELVLQDAAQRAEILQEEHHLVWDSIKNAASKVRLLGGFALFFAFGGLITILVSPYESRSDFILTLLIYFIIPVAIFFICRIAVKRGWVTNRHDTYLSRRTGLVTLTWKGKRVSYPFDEFDAAIQYVVGAAAQVDKYLFLIHRYTGAFCRNPGYRQENWQTEMDWELIQRYMDTAQPLPDIPMFELLRARDPVTAAHDIAQQRPQDYWTSMSRHEARRREKLATAAAKLYPWGRSREEAINWGWHPSGYGEAVYGEKVVPMKQTGATS